LQDINAGIYLQVKYIYRKSPFAGNHYLQESLFAGKYIYRFSLFTGNHYLQEKLFAGKNIYRKHFLQETLFLVKKSHFFKS